MINTSIIARFTISFFLFTGIYAFGQSEKEKPLYFYDEIGTLEVFFLPGEWAQGQVGYTLKKFDNGEWTDLHPGILFPHIDRSGKINNIIRNSSYKARLIEKRSRLLDEKKLNPLDSASFLKLLANPNMLKSISVMLRSDFDIALISGFGLHVSKGVSPGDQIGLFSESSRPSTKPVEVFNIDGATKIKLPVKSTYQRRKNKVEVTWETDVRTYDSLGILNGFNIYRVNSGGDTTKLNKSPIWMKRDSTKGFVYYKDQLKSDTSRAVYILKPVTIFNREAKGYSIKVEENKTGEITPPVLEALPGKPGEGAKLNWWATRDPLHKIIIKKKDSLSAEWTVLKKLNASDTSFLDGTALTVGSTRFYRLDIVDGVGKTYWSNIEYLAPVATSDIKTINDLSGKYIEEEGIIRLTWTNHYASDTTFLGYKLYSNTPPDTVLMYESGIGPIRGDHFDYPIDHYFARKYHFKIKPLFNNSYSGSGSNETEVPVPSEMVPPPVVTSYNKSDNGIRIYWNYPYKMSDLTGFKLLFNEQPDETMSIGPTKRSITIAMSEELESATILTLRAIVGNKSSESSNEVVVR